MLANAFGFADRLVVEIARANVAVSNQRRDEEVESVLLRTIQLFWEAAVVERQWKESQAAQEKYAQLVRDVRRRAGLYLTTPGEAPRLQAELESSQQRERSARALFQGAVDALRTALGIDSGEEIELQFPDLLPDLPKISPKTSADLRSVRVAEAEVVNLRRQRDRVNSSFRSRLDFIARAKSTGVDQSYPEARDEMTSVERPTYFVGLEFEAPLDSSLNRGAKAEAEVAVLQAENNLLIEKRLNQDQLVAADRDVLTQFENAKSAISTVQLRQKVLKEIELSYKQGRQSMVELIRAHNDLLNAQIERARAVGQYQIILSRRAALRDELYSANN
jgi:outer membrane protein TolC